MNPRSTRSGGHRSRARRDRRSAQHEPGAISIVGSKKSMSGYHEALASSAISRFAPTHGRRRSSLMSQPSGSCRRQTGPRGNSPAAQPVTRCIPVRGFVFLLLAGLRIRRIRDYRESDRAWAAPFLKEEFGGSLQARRCELLDVLALPGFVAERDAEPIGLVTYRLEGDECESCVHCGVRAAARRRNRASGSRASGGCRLRAGLARHNQRQPRAAPLLPTAWVRALGASHRGIRSGPQETQTADLNAR